MPFSSTFRMKYVSSCVNRPAPFGFRCCFSDFKYSGWVKSPVATSLMPLVLAEAAMDGMSMSRLVARENREWICRSAMNCICVRHSSYSPGQVKAEENPDRDSPPGHQG